MSNQNVGTIIKSERIKKGWTQDKLAEVSNISLKTIQRVEKGENVKQNTIDTITGKLKIDSTQLKNMSEAENEIDESLEKFKYSLKAEKVISVSELITNILSTDYLEFENESFESEEQYKVVIEFCEALEKLKSKPEEKVLFSEKLKVELEIKKILEKIENEKIKLFFRKRDWEDYEHIDIINLQPIIESAIKIYIYNSNNPDILKNKDREFIIVGYEEPEPPPIPVEDFMELEDDISPFLIHY